MSSAGTGNPLTLWASSETFLGTPPSHPLLLHETPAETNPELVFWNPLRSVLRETVHVRRFTDMSQAGRLVVIPHAICDYRRAGRLGPVLAFSRKVVRSGRVPVLFTGAFEYRRARGEILFSTSAYRGPAAEAAELATPGWLFDLGDSGDPQSRPDIPTVGFAGAVSYPGRLNRLMSALPMPGAVVRSGLCSPTANKNLPLGARQYFARSLRAEVLQAVRNGNLVAPNVLMRQNHFFTQDESHKRRAREEYVANIRSNAYTLCMRGTENFSYRLYEVMSAGRIPVIIDTNMRLPSLDGFGDWREFSVIVPFEEAHLVGEHIRRFHDGLSADGFRHACRRAREAFEYLLPHRFMSRAIAGGLFDRPPE